VIPGLLGSIPSCVFSQTNGRTSLSWCSKPRKFVAETCTYYSRVALIWEIATAHWELSTLTVTWIMSDGSKTSLLKCISALQVPLEKQHQDAGRVIIFLSYANAAGGISLTTMIYFWRSLSLSSLVWTMALIWYLIFALQRLRCLGSLKYIDEGIPNGN